MPIRSIVLIVFVLLLRYQAIFRPSPRPLPYAQLLFWMVLLFNTSCGIQLTSCNFSPSLGNTSFFTLDVTQNHIGSLMKNLMCCLHHLQRHNSTKFKPVADHLSSCNFDGIAGHLFGTLTTIPEFTPVLPVACTDNNFKSSYPVLSVPVSTDDNFSRRRFINKGLYTRVKYIMIPCSILFILKLYEESLAST